MSKTGLAIAFGTGYVLGARAGRERYEEIRRMWARVSGSPTVQRAAEKTKEVAGDQAKRSLYAVQRGVEKAGTAVKERLHRDGESDMDAAAGTTTWTTDELGTTGGPVS